MKSINLVHYAPRAYLRQGKKLSSSSTFRRVRHGRPDRRDRLLLRANHLGHPTSRTDLSVTKFLDLGGVAAFVWHLGLKSYKETLGADDDVVEAGHGELVAVDLEAEPALETEASLDLLAKF
jgi:hypothetical protein